MNIMKEFKNKNGDILNIQEIKKQYFSYSLRKDIAKINNCSWQQIDKIIRTLKWKRLHKPKYNLNENFFDVVDSESKAYFLGLLLADGSISKNNRVLKISLQENDKHILETFKNQIKSNSPLFFTKSKNKKHSNYYTLTLYSKKICEDLIKLGCVNNKSKYLKWNVSDIPNEIQNHFIRGYFDGDGCFSYRFHKKKYLKSVVNFTSTKDFCIGLQILIKELFSYNSYMSTRHKNNKSNNRTIEITGNIQVFNLLNWVYKNSTIFLLRKRKKVEEFMNMYKKRS